MSETPPPTPQAIGHVAQALAARGHAVAWVGGCLRDFLRGETSRDYDLATSAPVSVLVDTFARGVPIGRDTVMVPTERGPVDITPFHGNSLDDDLGHRDYTVNAIAWDAVAQRWHDPHGGRRDLEENILRPVGNLADRLREDPLRALRAARFVSTLGLSPAPGLAKAIARHAPPLRGVAPERLRREVERLVLGPHAAAGLAFLRASGVEAMLSPLAGDAPLRPWIDALPTRLEIRLAAWLAGSDPQVTLGPLRFGEARIAAVARRTARHPLNLLARESGSAPVDCDASPAPPPRPLAARIRHLLSKAGPEVVEDLVLMREAELGEPLVAFRNALREAIAAEGTALRRRDLALDGRAVMEALGASPGRRVGVAIRYLLDCVLDDPSLNTEERLRACLDAWQRGEP